LRDKELGDGQNDHETDGHSDHQLNQHRAALVCVSCQHVGYPASVPPGEQTTGRPKPLSCVCNCATGVVLLANAIAVVIVPDPPPAIADRPPWRGSTEKPLPPVSVIVTLL